MPYSDVNKIAVNENVQLPIKDWRAPAHDRFQSTSVRQIVGINSTQAVVRSAAMIAVRIDQILKA